MDEVLGLGGLRSSFENLKTCVAPVGLAVLGLHFSHRFRAGLRCSAPCGLGSFRHISLTTLAGNTGSLRIPPAARGEFLGM